MNRNSKQTLISIWLMISGFAAVVAASSLLEKNRPAPPAGFEDEDLAVQGVKLKGFALGFEGLLADWYWIKSLQYIGDKLLNSKESVSIDDLKPLNPRLLYQYLDNATMLDPQFFRAYQYGAVVLPTIDNEQAIKLIQKGIEANPNDWRLYHYLGFIYWRLGDYEKSAEIYDRSSQLAGSPDFTKMMAARIKTEGSNRATAREMYQEMLEQAEDINIRNLAARRLFELDSLDERDIIQKNLADFKSKNNRCANNWVEIFPLLQQEKLPGNKNFRVDAAGNVVDPSGAAYILDKENCAVKLNTEKTKIPLY